jgi:branched-chain amino acid aminotransferase
VHVLSHALHYGTAVFEGLRAYATRQGPAILCLREHVDRLFDSCRILGMELAYTPDDVADAILETVRANRHDACYIRPIAYRGYGVIGVDPTGGRVELAIAAFPWPAPMGTEKLERGIRVGVSSWRRMAPDTHPALAKAAGNYVSSQLVVLEAKRHGYDEGLALDVDGYVAEGSGQNVFLARRGELSTPPVGASILAGITRGIAITLARDRGIAVREQRIPRELLYACDEVFLTGTASEIVPVREVDGRAVGRGEPGRGPLTARLQADFHALVRGEVEDRHRWLTPV